MNRCVISFLVTGLILVFLVGCAGGNKSIRDEAPPDSEIRVYEVFGMDCPGCHGGVEKLVDRIEGIEASEANWENQTLIVAVKRDAEVSDEEIEDAVREANFTPGERIE